MLFMRLISKMGWANSGSLGRGKKFSLYGVRVAQLSPKQPVAVQICIEVPMTVKYLHRSYMGSWYVDCEILPSDFENTYKIKYLDPVTEEIEYKLVSKSELKFPEFSEYII